MTPRRTPLALLLLLFCVAGGPAVRGDERSTAARFEEARKDEPSLIAFLQGMPKGADLHNHAGGAEYAEFALENAIAQGFFFDPATSTFVRETAPGRVPATKLLQDDKLLSQFLDAVSIRGLRPGTVSGHDHFFRTFGVLASAREALRKDEMLAEIVGRAKSQNLQYLELMYTPAADALWRTSDGAPPVDDPEQALEVLKPKLEAYVRAAQGEIDHQDLELARRLVLPPPVSSTQGPLTLRYIVSASRTRPDNEVFAVLAAGMTLMKADPRCVGVNLVSPEDHPNARMHFDRQMQLLDVLWKRFDHPNITLHAGELTLAISPVEPMHSRIRRSIEVGHARRIGHAVSVAWEENLPGLLREMREQGIAMEICLTSNDAILGVAGDRHPFNLYRRAGAPITLNTDDEGVNRSNITMEYVRAVRAYALSYADLKTLARNSIEYSFLPGTSLYQARDFRRPLPEFARVRDRSWAPSSEAQRLMAANDKLSVQVRLEREIVAFENPGSP